MKLKKITLLFSALAVMLLFISKCYSYQGEKETLTVDGRERTFTVNRDKSLEGRASVPLVVVLHGGGGTGARMRKACGFDAIAAREGFITVYPDAYKNHWNDMRGGAKTYSHANGVNDVKFLSTVIESVATRHNIDRRRIYMAGASNGGMMTHLFSIKKGGEIAAAAAVISSIPETLKDEKPVRPVPMLIMNATKDALVKWEGGEVAFNGGRVISARDGVKFWVKNNGCAEKPLVTRLADRDPKDGSSVEKEFYAAGDGRSDVVFYIIHGGGHSWPGKNFGPIYRWIIDRDGQSGAACMDIDAAEEIWAFFKNKKI